jgi:triacylglycerol lipase
MIMQWANRHSCALTMVFAFFQCSAATANPVLLQADCVILLHGLARTSASMEKMEKALRGDGYIVVNDTYPSRHNTIQVLAPLAIDAGLENCGELAENRQVHFVTHSLGGILVRYYFAGRELANLGRVVMLAPPNQGSAAADRLGWLPGIEQINGPAGKQLGKGDNSIPLDLGIPEFEFAVIAGDRSIDPVSSAVLANPDDGKVSVADTKLEGMADFALIHVSHAYIMKDKEVIELVLNFLENGQFREQQQSHADAAQP